MYLTLKNRHLVFPSHFSSINIQVITKDSHISHKIQVAQKCIVGSYDIIDSEATRSPNFENMLLKYNILYVMVYLKKVYSLHMSTFGYLQDHKF